MKTSLIIIFTFLCQSLFSQELSPEIFEKIYTGGQEFTTHLKQGKIELFKNAGPPKDTWTYSKLEEYKRNLNSGNIIYGEIIMPSMDEKHYSYNLFAYDTQKEAYYFVAIVSYSILNNDVKLNHSFLFTEEKSLKEWWLRISYSYKSGQINKVPEKYLLFKICPPPPFKV